MEVGFRKYLWQFVEITCQGCKISIAFGQVAVRIRTRDHCQPVIKNSVTLRQNDYVLAIRYDSSGVVAHRSANFSSAHTLLKHSTLLLCGCQ